MNSSNNTIFKNAYANLMMSYVFTGLFVYSLSSGCTHLNYYLKSKDSLISKQIFVISRSIDQSNKYPSRFSTFKNIDFDSIASQSNKQIRELPANISLDNLIVNLEQCKTNEDKYFLLKKQSDTLSEIAYKIQKNDPGSRAIFDILFSLVSLSGAIYFYKQYDSFKN